MLAALFEGDFMRHVSGMSVVLLSGLWGCYSITSEDADCTEKFRCYDDIVQRCEAGVWRDVEDCYDNGGVCEMDAAFATCVANEFKCPYDDKTTSESEHGMRKELLPDTDGESDALVADTAEDPDASTDGTDDITTDTFEEETETVTSPSVVFSDYFDGGTVFDEIAYPEGDPHRCTNPNGVSFSNDGTRQAVTLQCYDEALLEVELRLPSDEYDIVISWATGNDPHSWDGCNRAGFHSAFGASCITPNRIVLVNGELLHETAGQLMDFGETTTIPYTGEITSIILGASSAGTTGLFETYYDYVEVLKK